MISFRRSLLTTLLAHIKPQTSLQHVKFVSSSTATITGLTKMQASLEREIWVQPKSKISQPFLCPFGKCILKELHCEPTSSCHFDVEMIISRDKVTLVPMKDTANMSNESKHESILNKPKRNKNIARLGHSSSCPAFHQTTSSSSSLQDQTPYRIQLACAILVISSDQKVLLTQRSSKLRAFPNAWVVPGGKNDLDDDSLEHTAIRELYEETGIDTRTTTHNHTDTPPLNLLCMWESCYPIHVQDGPIKRQHSW